VENLQEKQQFRERASVPSTRLNDVMMKQTKGEIESFTDNSAADSADSFLGNSLSGKSLNTSTFCER
jgi:hypothetical protein